MQYKEYGKTGDNISILGFGAMRLPMVDDHLDMDLAVSYVDNAVGYCNGESQIAVGKAVKGRRDKNTKKDLCLSVSYLFLE